MRPTGAMHMIDTLSAAGAERVAVNIVNHLPRDKYAPYLCTTRSDGPLEALVAPDVVRVRLRRKGRFDAGAVLRLRRVIRSNGIRLLHAHSSALFIARMAAAGTNARIVWHAHFGRYATEDRRAYHYRMATAGIGGAITVNAEMKEWCTRRLKLPSKLVWYLPNPVSLNDGSPEIPAESLPGALGQRIICLANFRPEKDHFTLVRAMARVAREAPSAHLLLAGKTNHAAYKKAVEEEIAALGLAARVSILGERHDVSAILRGCNIGVLSSASEGLPMSLLEYGAAGLPAVATDVGQCPDVLDHGRAGILVPKESPEKLASALLSLLRSPEERKKLGDRSYEWVSKTFGAETVMRQLCGIYETVLGGAMDCGERTQAERDILTSQTWS
ncbi:MAG: glycosyltransferase [Candidatus Acidiferrales bacterium]